MATKGDRFVDITLRVLTAVVSVVLLGAAALLVWRSVAPAAPEPATVPLVETRPPQAAPAAAPAVTDEPPAVIYKPGQVVKCTQNGRTVFSDQPCPEPAPAAAK
jgi:hypothetical protein